MLLIYIFYFLDFRTVRTYFQKKLYMFLRHTLEHWPLDASFRLFLETWLSYIQPWRYVVNAPKGGDAEKVVDLKWQTFVAENLLFFTLFLQKIILRFLRVELCSTKTSLMLYRISKVSYFNKNIFNLKKTFFFCFSLFRSGYKIVSRHCRFILSEM